MSSTSATPAPATTPSTGDVIQNVENTRSKRVCSPVDERKMAVSEKDYELRLWIHHGRGGLPHLPTTGDSIEYDNTNLEGNDG